MKFTRRARRLQLPIPVVTLFLTVFVFTPLSAQQGLPGQPPPAQTQPQPGAPGVQQFGDWGRQCEALPGGQRPQCFIFQNVFLKQNRHRILQLAVGLFGAGQKQGAIVQVPLGLYLPAGLTLEIPGAKPIRIIVEVCLRTGCRASVELSDQIIQAMKKGGRAVMKLRDARRRELTLPISLNGFAAGFDSLTQG